MEYDASQKPNAGSKVSLASPISKRILASRYLFFARPDGIKTTHFANDSHYYIYSAPIRCSSSLCPIDDRASDSVKSPISSTEIGYTLGLIFLTLFDVFVVWFRSRGARRRRLQRGLA
jgi:hypothetical protein